MGFLGGQYLPLPISLAAIFLGPLGPVLLKSFTVAIPSNSGLDVREVLAKKVVMVRSTIKTGRS